MAGRGEEQAWAPWEEDEQGGAGKISGRHPWELLLPALNRIGGELDVCCCWAPARGRCRGWRPWELLPLRQGRDGSRELGRHGWGRDGEGSSQVAVAAVKKKRQGRNGGVGVKNYQFARERGPIYRRGTRVRVFSWAKWARLEWAWPKTRTRVTLN
jgi:hypothetical protein